MLLQNINTSMENSTSQTEAGITEEMHGGDSSRSPQKSEPVEEKVYFLFSLFFKCFLYIQSFYKLTLPCSILEMLLIFKKWLL